MRILVSLRKRFTIKNCFLFATSIVGFYIAWMCLMSKYFTEPVPLPRNYFQTASRLWKMGRLVDTKTCKIPDFDPFDGDVLPFYKIAQPLEQCNETHYNWSRLNNNELIINRSQVEYDGYQFYPGFCCYKVLERVTLTEEEQKSREKLKNADNVIKYSTCIDINAEVTEMNHEFILVECGWTKFIPVAVAYRAFHGSATVQGSQKRENLEKKINYWKSRGKGDHLPPNILILGVDSTSRLSFRRNMFQTRKILEEFEAVEMMGYTKVGHNTFPNFLPLLTGYREEDVRKICMDSNATPQDSCPNIWKRFDSVNYITSHSEDSPDVAIYNYFKTGFVQQPVDFYLRPLMQSAQDYGHPSTLYLVKREFMNCIGQDTVDEAILSYVESILDLGHRTGTPVYSLSWSTRMAHANLNNIQLIDSTYATFLRRLLDKGYLENTILIFMGDHGFRRGPFPETLLGYYENNLPNMWIKLPPRIRKEFPGWQKGLEINSRRLTSPFTMYWTLNQVLKTFSSLESPKSSHSKTGELMDRKHVQNFFEAVPEDNTCDDVGVREQYCPCYLPQKVLLTDPLLKEAAVLALNATNRELSGNCASLKVKRIIAGMAVSKSVLRKRFIVAFTTEPGDFSLEAEIDYFGKNEKFSDQPSVQRTSTINKDHIGCIKDSKMELFCYCI